MRTVRSKEHTCCQKVGERDPTLQKRNPTWRKCYKVGEKLILLARKEYIVCCPCLATLDLGLAQSKSSPLPRAWLPGPGLGSCLCGRAPLAALGVAQDSTQAASGWQPLTGSCGTHLPIHGYQSLYSCYHSDCASLSFLTGTAARASVT